MFRTCAVLLLSLLACTRAGSALGNNKPNAATPVVTLAGPICAKGRPDTYPRLLSNGVSIRLYLVGPYVGEGSLPVGQRYRERYAFSVVNVSGRGGTGSIVVVLGKDLAKTRAALDQQIADICAPWLKTNYRIDDVGFQDVRWRNAEAARASRQLIDARRAAERTAAEAAKALQARLQAVPTIAELDIFLRANWETRRAAFPPEMEDTKFARVHDARCSRKRGKAQFSCLVGVTAESSRGPEYEQGTLNCSRTGQGKLTCEDAAEDIIITWFDVYPPARRTSTTRA